ncbi:MAG: glycosyltransferase family 2 protein [Lachnospiraceae bacterium]|jgi:glycosyltransferase EpsE
MPKVSVIMGTYNGEKTLDAAIQSICDQTFTDWEFIICDDCSTDGTWEKILKWEKKDSRIKGVRNSQNMKIAASSNRCIALAEGSYIAKMDDDDVSYSTRLEKQVQFLEQHPDIAFVSSLVDCYDGEKIVKNHFDRKAEPQKEDFLSGTQFVNPGLMIRRECLERVNGYRVEKRTRRTEDYDLFMRLYAEGYKGYNIQERLLRYFVNPEAMKKKRKYRYRIDEAQVRFEGFKALGLLPKGILYVFRPLVVGLIPHQLIWKWKYKKGRL